MLATRQLQPQGSGRKARRRLSALPFWCDVEAALVDSYRYDAFVPHTRHARLRYHSGHVSMQKSGVAS